MKKIFKYLIIGVVVWFVLHTIYSIFDGIREPDHHADIVVILGNKVNEDGSLSTRLEKRMETGLALYNKKMIDKIVVSGGLGKEGFYEGDKMKDYLVSKGVPDSNIIVDNYGDNTEATVENLFELKKDMPFESVIVVSQYYHISRAKQLLKQYGFDNIQSASPKYLEWRDLYSISREFIAYYVNLL